MLFANNLRLKANHCGLTPGSFWGSTPCPRVPASLLVPHLFIARDLVDHVMIQIIHQLLSQLFQFSSFHRRTRPCPGPPRGLTGVFGFEPYGLCGAVGPHSPGITIRFTGIFG